MKTKEKIIEEFDKGHKGEEMMEVAEARAEILIALSQQKQEIMSIIQKEIAKADKYQIAPLERIRIEILNLTN